MIGQRIGNYEVTGLLAEGGMGAVYTAVHPAIGRRAAIKVLHPEMASQPELVTRFFNEARASNAIRHPGIVEIFDFGALPGGASYIAMEFLEGMSLAHRIRAAGRLPIDTAVDIAMQAASALGAAHAKGIVHRDLKPDNLFLVPDPAIGRERVKVLDFGIAKLGAGGLQNSVKTRTGTVMGTPAYMSPEQCRGTTEVDHRTDIYALGIILYEMCCGQPPFMSEGFGEMVHMQIAQTPTAPRVHNPDIPPALEAIIVAALAKDPNGRPNDMDAFRSALAAAAKGTSSAAPAARTMKLEAAQGAAGGTRLLAPQTAPRVNTTTFSGATGDRSSDTSPSRPRKRFPLTTPVLLLTVVVAGGVGLWAAVKRDPPAAPAPEPAAQQPTPSPRVTVAIKSTPAGARVVRSEDGALLGVTPFDARWPRDTGVASLRVEHEGYAPQSVAVPRDLGLDVTLTLTPLPKAVEAAPPADSVIPAAKPPAPASRRRSRAPAAEPVEL